MHMRGEKAYLRKFRKSQTNSVCGLGVRKMRLCVSGLLPLPTCSAGAVINAGPAAGMAASARSVPHRVPSMTVGCRADAVAPGNEEAVEAGSTLNRIG